jgi:hypothetical protein
MYHPPNALQPPKPHHSAPPTNNASVHIEAKERTNPHVRQIARGLINFARYQTQLEHFLVELPKLDSAITEGHLYERSAFFWHDQPFIAIDRGQLVYRIDPTRSTHTPHSRSEPWSPVRHVIDNWRVLTNGDPATWLDYAKRALNLVKTESDEQANTASPPTSP